MRRGPGAVTGLVTGLLVGLLAGLLVVSALALTTAAPAGAAVVGAAPAATTHAPSGVRLVLESLSPTAVTPGSHVQAALRIVNDSASPVTGARVRLFVNSPVLTTRSAVRAWAADEGVQGGDRFSGLAGAERALPETLPPGGSTDLTITVSADQMRLGSAWGPRGVTIDVLDGHLDRLDVVRTFLVWTPGQAPGAGSAGLAVLTPVTPGAPDLATGAPSAATLTTLTGNGGRLARVVASAGVMTSLVVDPSSLSAGAAPGWVDALRRTATATGGLAALPLDDADVESAAAARAGDLYDTAVSAGRDGVAPLGSASAGVLAWPPDGTLDGDSLGLAAGAGAGAAVVSATGSDTGRVTVSGVDDGAGSADSGGSGGSSASRVRLAALAVDPEASAVLAEATTVPGGEGPDRSADTAHSPSPAEATARLLAETAVATRSGAGVVLATPRTWDPDPAVAASVLGVVAGASWVHPQSVATLLRARSTAVVNLPASSSHAAYLPAAGLRGVLGALRSLGPISQVVADPTALTAPLRARAVAATSLAWRDQQGPWQEGVDAIARAAADEAAGVRVVRSSPVTVISSRAKIPVTIANALSQSATVEVVLKAGNLRITTPQPLTTTIAPGSQTQVRMPVRALANGDVKVTVQVRTRSGALVATGAPLPVRVRAQWEGRAVTITGVVIALVLLVGIGRTVRRVRRTRRSGPADATSRTDDPTSRTDRTDRTDPVRDPAPGAPAPRTPGTPGAPASPPAPSRPGADLDDRDRARHHA